MISKEELQNKRRILVIGCSGSGKSTFAKMLGDKLNLEVLHLDKYFHKPKWESRSHAEFTIIVRELILKDEWVMDGNYSKTLEIRAQRCDMIFFFDFSRYFCIHRVLKRSFKTITGIEIRTDLADGCQEKFFDYEFIKFIWNFKKNVSSLNYEIFERLNLTDKELIIFRSKKELNIFLKNINL